jgi:hypothetical protein
MRVTPFSSYLMNALQHFLQLNARSPARANFGAYRSLFPTGYRPFKVQAQCKRQLMRPGLKSHPAMQRDLPENNIAGNWR